MENAKNFILSLKFPFSLVKENRFLWDALGGSPAESGGEVLPADPALDKKMQEKIKRSEEIQKEMTAVDKDLNDKETELGKVVDDFKALPEPVEDEDKQDFEKKVADLRKDLTTLKKKKVDLALEERELASYKDPRVEAFVEKTAMEKLRKELDEGKIKFLDGLKARLDSVKIAERRAEFKINSDLWDITTKSGVDAVKKDWVNLKIYEDTPFFNNIFTQLGTLSDPKVLEKLTPEEKKAYLAPKENDNRITNTALKSAINFFFAVKSLLKQQDIAEGKTMEMTQEKDQDKIASTAIKFVTDNVKKFQDAIKQKDWGTAFVYVLGAYVAYKGAVEIWKRTPDLAKKGIYAAGFLYVANMFAENAGYHPLKALGVTGLEDEVRDTPLSHFYNLGIPEAKDMDARVLRDVAFANVSDLNSLYIESSNGFIDPNQLPGHFPQFRGMSPSVLSEENPPDSKKQEYKRVGKQLYTIMGVVRKAYEMYIKPKNGGLTFEAALNANSDLKNANLMRFAMAFKDFAKNPSGRLTGEIVGQSLGLYSYKMRKRFEDVFRDKKMDFVPVHTPLERGVYSAQVMNFPVVIKEDSTTNEYVVFSRYDYDNAKGHPDSATQALCKIPFEGNADAQAEQLKDAVIRKFVDVVDKLKGSAKDSFEFTNPTNPTDLTKPSVEYKGGRFVSHLNIKAGVGSLMPKAEEMEVFLKVSKDGSTIEVYKVSDNELLINLDSSGDRSKLVGNLVLAGLCKQDNMKPFLFLYKANKLEFKGQNMDGSFDVVAGDSRTPIKFKLVENPTTKVKEYVFADPKEEAKLFNAKNYAFLRELAENAVRENKEWKREVERFANVLENVPEEYLVNVFKNVPNWWKGATSHKWFGGFSLDQFTGSIPKNYTNAMVDAQAEFLISGMVVGLTGSKSLKDAVTFMNNDSDIKSAAQKLDRLSTKLSNIKEQKERDKKAFTSDEFRDQILGGVDGASKLAVKSDTYSLWYDQFSTYIFMKYGKDGIIPGRVNKAAKIVSVYAAYTHKMDDKNLDGKTVTDPLYDKYSTYSNYVAERMFRKLNEDKMPEDIPARGSYWEIDDFDTFEKNWEDDEGKKKYASVGVTLKDEEGKESKGEMLAEREALKMSGDYITFDEYLRLNKKDRAARAPIERGETLPKNLILPREDCKLTFRSKQDKKMYMDLLNRTDVYTRNDVDDDGNAKEYDVYSTNRYTELEREFRTLLVKKLEELKDEFKDEYDPKAFEFLEHEKYDFALLDTPLSNDNSVETIDFKFSEESVFNVHIADIEDKLANRSAKTPVTKSMQMELVKKQVQDIVEQDIVHENVFYHYFNKMTVWEKISAKYEKIKNKLF